MPVPTGYYDVNRNAIARGMTTPAQNAGYTDPNSPYPFAASGYDTTMNPDPSQGTDVVLQSGTKHFAPDQQPWIGYIEGKNNDQPVAAVEGSDEAKHYQRQLNTARNQSIIQMLALMAGGATVAGAAPWSAAAGAAPEAVGGAEGLGEVTVPSAGAYLPAESLSSAAAPTLGMTAPTAGGAEVGTGAAGGGFDWQGMLKHANPFGGSGDGGNPQYGDYSRIAEQLSRNQLQDQRKQVMAQQQAQGPSLQERRRHRIAALLQAGSPA